MWLVIALLVASLIPSKPSQYGVVENVHFVLALSKTSCAFMCPPTFTWHLLVLECKTRGRQLHLAKVLAPKEPSSVEKKGYKTNQSYAQEPTNTYI